MLVDGRPALILARTPQRMAAATAVSGDVVGLVLSGAAAPTMPPTVCPKGLASVAVLVPVAHRTTVRAAIPLGGGPAAVEGLASSAAAVRGWKAQSPGRDGLHVEVPDVQLQRAFDATGRSLLLVGSGQTASAGEAALLGAALVAIGRSRAASDAPISEPPTSTTALIASVTGHRIGAAAGHPAVAGPAGYDVVATMAAAAAELAAGDAAALGRLAWLLGVGGPTWAWPDHVHPRTGSGSDGRGHSPTATAAFLLLVRDLLVTEPEPGDAVLLPVLPDAWRGQPVRVDDAILSGDVRLSYAVRWHGERPALLWEASSALRLTAPGLDATFLTDEPRGEALLSSPAPPAGSGGGGTVELS